MPPPAVIPEYLPPTEVPAPPVENFEQPFSFLMFGMETDPELVVAMLDLSQYYLEPLEEPPILTKEELLAKERKLLEEAETIAEKNYKMWLREIYGLVLP
ncbi:hypothetical protein RHMOL_Rhmol10G0121300 [Rhododendron molle]|uniref:Uncharacterized protein n=1 Tax=Rhododendron molle TaxID=49168 RepID=A0ACC0M2D5_RHOML|nr:hypothetical protein RHMOL_Rhmol10G0121300 [Rhododendron molle]